MKIMIKSTQFYGDSTQQIAEKYEDASVLVEPDRILIEYEKGSMILYTKEKTFWMKRGKNELSIMINQKSAVKYETEYGKIDLEVKGETMLYQVDPLKIVVKYRIMLKEMTEYLNTVEILEV